MKNSIILVTLFLLLNGCQNSENQKLGSKNNPVKFYFTPSINAETINQTSVHMMNYLEKQTGLHFKTGIPTSYIAVVEAFGSKRADIAIINSFGYLLANEKYNAQAQLRVIRFGSDSYRGQIIANNQSNIDSLEDIQGKRFAYTDASSSSGYLFPYKLFKEKGISPSNTVFAMKHDNVVTMVYQGQVDAGATYYSPPDKQGNIRDARVRVKTQFPDVEEKVKIISITDPIPNDPVVFRHGIDTSIINLINKALINYSETDKGKKNLKTLYNIEGFVKSSNEDYNQYRETLETINIEAESLIK